MLWKIAGTARVVAENEKLRLQVEVERLKLEMEQLPLEKEETDTQDVPPDGEVKSVVCVASWFISSLQIVSDESRRSTSDTRNCPMPYVPGESSST